MTDFGITVCVFAGGFPQGTMWYRPPHNDTLFCWAWCTLILSWLLFVIIRGVRSPEDTTRERCGRFAFLLCMLTWFVGMASFAYRAEGSVTDLVRGDIPKPVVMMAMLGGLRNFVTYCATCAVALIGAALLLCSRWGTGSHGASTAYAAASQVRHNDVGR